MALPAAGAGRVSRVPRCAACHVVGWVSRAGFEGGPPAVAGVSFRGGRDDAGWRERRAGRLQRVAWVACLFRAAPHAIRDYFGPPGTQVGCQAVTGAIPRSNLPLSIELAVIFRLAALTISGCAIDDHPSRRSVIPGLTSGAPAQASSRVRAKPPIFGRFVAVGVSSGRADRRGEKCTRTHSTSYEIISSRCRHLRNSQLRW